MQIYVDYGLESGTQAKLKTTQSEEEEVREGRVLEDEDIVAKRKTRKFAAYWQ